MSLKLGAASALNLTLSGTFGSFRVGRPSASTSVRADYLLTRIGLNFETGSDQAVLQHLAPVRELFDIETLEFDELLQRDIDDARVSHELIPYLLDDGTREAVKLFPPIVVVVMPLRADDRRPADAYPPVVEREEPDDGTRDHSLHTIQSGEVGSEAFRFERPIVGGQINDHDLVRLKLNTNKVGLVIVDGQHRAMALLALFRNLKGEWSDARRAPYKDYYTQWPSDHIRAFDLSRVSMPAMFCTFPDLTKNYGGEYDVKRAARSVFLTLNKTARPVSTSRNRLLDDNDLVSLFLRRTLSRIKRRTDSAEKSLRIHSVELDQAHDRTKVTDQIAITGVNHVFYVIEHLIMGRPREDVDGMVYRRTRRRDRTDLASSNAGLERIRAADQLGADRVDTIRRDVFDDRAARELGETFDEHLGRHIERVYADFEPFERHSRAILQLRQSLESNQDSRVRPILLEGQGIERTFEAHRNQIKDRIQSAGEGIVATALRATAERLDGTHKQVEATVRDFRVDRAGRYLADVSDKANLKTDSVYADEVVAFINRRYTDLYSTVAFQAALVCVFFDSLYCAVPHMEEKAIEGELEIYLQQLSNFFIPKTASEFRRLVSVLEGEMTGKPSEWNVVPRSPSTFRQIVYRPEMQPDQWPRYKALILELWQPGNTELMEFIWTERDYVRKQVMSSLRDEEIKEEARRRGVRPEALPDQDLQSISVTSAQNYLKYLELVGASNRPKLSELQAMVEINVEQQAEDVD